MGADTVAKVEGKTSTLKWPDVAGPPGSIERGMYAKASPGTRETSSSPVKTTALGLAAIQSEARGGKCVLLRREQNK